MNECVIIGNGPSRKRYDLDSIELPTFGCNQIYKECRVDYLWAQDPHVIQTMAKETIDQTVWVPYKQARDLPQLPFIQAYVHSYDPGQRLLTGEWCIVQAAELGFEVIRLIGFDGGPHSIYRSLTDTNCDLNTCQPNAQRYNHTFGKFLQHFPRIKIITDDFFLCAYRDK